MPVHTLLPKLLDLDEKEKLIADQILGSLDSDGYFRRELEAVVDNITFNEGVLTSKEQVDAAAGRSGYANRTRSYDTDRLIACKSCDEEYRAL